MDNEKELIANLEKEIQDKQEELNSIKYNKMRMMLHKSFIKMLNKPCCKPLKI